MAYTCLLSLFFTFIHVKKLWFVQLCRFLDKMVVRKEDWEAKSSEGTYGNVREWKEAQWFISEYWIE